MGKKISSETRKELLDAMRRRYHESSKRDKARILDEFIALTGYHRKHGIRLLQRDGDSEIQPLPDVLVRTRRVYEEAVRETLTILWEASDRICGKRLKAILPELVDACAIWKWRCGQDLAIEASQRILILRQKTPH